MKLKMYSVFDSKVTAYRSPLCLRTRGEMLREWGDLVNDPTTQFAKYPADFTLFEIGDFDQETGAIECYEAKIALGTALDFQAKNPSLENVSQLVSNK